MDSVRHPTAQPAAPLMDDLRMDSAETESIAPGVAPRTSHRVGNPKGNRRARSLWGRSRSSGKEPGGKTKRYAQKEAVQCAASYVAERLSGDRKSELAGARRDRISAFGPVDVSDREPVAKSRQVTERTLISINDRSTPSSRLDARTCSQVT